MNFLTTIVLAMVISITRSQTVCTGSDGDHPIDDVWTETMNPPGIDGTCHCDEYKDHWIDIGDCPGSARQCDAATKYCVWKGCKKSGRPSEQYYKPGYVYVVGLSTCTCKSVNDMAEPPANQGDLYPEEYNWHCVSSGGPPPPQTR
ncbi:unnamed protein product [Owenia fusiformis]|uniref:Uncharacterized protein n=1 Tax=Owenia fusiformis TaxID=6347 RepID=A0A8J1Y9K6_OWEFU|nr:unnamed protein product [Owenia fusiformis]